MRFMPSRHKDDSDKLPISSTRTSHDIAMDPLHDRNDSLTAPMSPTKPLPTRTTSTRILQPNNVARTTTTITGGPGPHHSNSVSGRPERPGLQRRRTTAQTRYIEMLLALDSVPRLHNILASFFTWILLAGYIVFPATFNKIQDSSTDDEVNKEWQKHALQRVRNIPLLYIAAFACGIGIFGCLWLWWKHRTNYVWVINRIFLAALMNSIAGLISTIINIYSAQDGQYSVTAKMTIIVTAVSSVVAAGLFLLYNSVMLALVKRRHVKETREAETRFTGEEFLEDRKRKKKQEKGKKESGLGIGIGADPGRVV